MKPKDGVIRYKIEATIEFPLDAMEQEYLDETIETLRSYGTADIVDVEVIPKQTTKNR